MSRKDSLTSPRTYASADEAFAATQEELAKKAAAENRRRSAASSSTLVFEKVEVPLFPHSITTETVSAASAAKATKSTPSAFKAVVSRPRIDTITEAPKPITTSGGAGASPVDSDYNSLESSSSSSSSDSTNSSPENVAAPTEAKPKIETRKKLSSFEELGIFENPETFTEAAKVEAITKPRTTETSAAHKASTTATAAAAQIPQSRTRGLAPRIYEVTTGRREDGSLTMRTKIPTEPPKAARTSTQARAAAAAENLFGAPGEITPRLETEGRSAVAPAENPTTSPTPTALEQKAKNSNNCVIV